MIKACYTLRIPIFSTTQSASRLGSLCHELTSIETVHTFPIIDKTAFSMLVPQLRDTLTSRSSYPYQVAIVGIETHICVTQTALDLLSEGHRVYVIMDGVSSCHEGERAVALDRLRQEGAIVTTSESFLYECMGDASIPEYVSSLVVIVKYFGSLTDDGRVLGSRRLRDLSRRRKTIHEMLCRRCVRCDRVSLLTSMMTMDVVHGKLEKCCKYGRLRLHIEISTRCERNADQEV